MRPVRRSKPLDTAGTRVTAFMAEDPGTRVMVVGHPGHGPTDPQLPEDGMGLGTGRSVGEGGRAWQVRQSKPLHTGGTQLTECQPGTRVTVAGHPGHGGGTPGSRWWGTRGTVLMAL